ncbi:MAG: hypothetical protein QF515_05315 [Pseudomonadales bacterium]|jgi:outer membrane receptor protein involved in Fe transport|nr:hypothetical protein [Pseudomonadales bacterium]MDP6826517.1 hypothetical protein [Pseudomonadales bacterium]|tara:strand:+ start:391 stop:720 length:330 start_codon:yes stop_codon:yes gene_type:complete
MRSQPCSNALVIAAVLALLLQSLAPPGYMAGPLSGGEPHSSGYALFNLKGCVRLAGGMRLSAGVDNVTDRIYADHLGGINRVRGNPDIPVGERLPGHGCNFFLRVDLEF